MFAFLLFWRLCHHGVLWIEEAYPLVGALEVLHGRWPYWDFWFDKPPGAILFYLLFGALPGLPLRFAGALYLLLCCWLAARLGGRWAAWLLAAYTSWGIPSATLALAPDLLLLAPHLGAVLLAQRAKPLLAGLVSGLALLVHSKGLFVLLAALLWAPHWRVLAGFAALLPLHALGASAYWLQVWEWGRLYSAHTFLTNPWREFGTRTLNWMGFHAAALAAMQFSRNGWRWWLWAGISLGSVLLGQRFFPRYYFFLLAPVCVMGGIALAGMAKRWRMAILSLLLIPALRFAPFHLRLLVGDDSHADLALFRDSRQIARTVEQQAKTGDTLFVWGYRPDISALARLSSGTPYLESQPLNCVLADRHLFSLARLPDPACAARLAEFRRYTPRFLVDGLGPLNPALALERFRPLNGYELVERTNSATLYRLVSPPDQPLEVRQANPAASTHPADASHQAAR
ncbi:MAG: hypothetical protein OHK0021_04370 [Bryobacter sp.]